MPPLLRFFLLFLLISVAAVLAARWIGSKRPPSSLARVMSGVDGAPCATPCLFGIRPGATSIDEARNILSVHPLTRGGSWQDEHTLQLIEALAYVAFSETADGKVDSIVLADDLSDSGIPVPGSLADTFTLGDVLLAFGKPSVGLPGSNYFVLGVPAFGMTASVALPNNFQTKMRPTSPMSQLMFSTYGPCPKQHDEFLVRKWMGFVTLQRYLSDRRFSNQYARPSGVPVPPFADCQK